MNFASEYRHVLSEVMNRGIVETNSRTRSRVRLLPTGHSFSLDLRDWILPTCGLRKTWPSHSAAEAAWCLHGERSIEWLSKHTKAWDEFADDSPPWHAGPVERWVHEAYGHRWRYAFAVDQLETGVQRLRKDPSDRRVWVSSWDPRLDIIDKKQKTVPCPVGFTLQIMGSELCSTITIRSSDLYFGLPYDVMRHSYVMAAVAVSLKIDLGFMQVCLANPHVYEAQWKYMTVMTCGSAECPMVRLPVWDVHDIVDDRDAYMAAVNDELKRYAGQWPKFNPPTEVVK